MVLAVAIGVLVAGWLMFRQQKQRAREMRMAGE